MASSFPTRACDDPELLPPGCLYPMYGLNVPSFLRMKGAPRGHEDLLSDDMLTLWRHGSFFTFVGHQWLGKKMPDPDGEQLDVLRRVLQNGFNVDSGLEDVIYTKFQGRYMQEKERKQLLAGHLWYDYFCVPQVAVRNGDKCTCATQKAVDSIPAYVALCNVFVALTPTVLHETGEVLNFGTYIKRGWCSAELAFWTLGELERLRPIVCVRDATAPTFMPSTLFLRSPPFLAQFTLESDRAAVCGLLRVRIEECLAACAQALVCGAAPKKRGETKRLAHYADVALMFAANEETLCGKTGDSPAAPAHSEVPRLSSSEWFASADWEWFRRKLGVTPTHFAAMRGDSQLIGDTSDIQVATKIDSVFWNLSGFQPLHLASSAACVRSLVELRADVYARASFHNFTPFGAVLANQMIPNARKMETIQELLHCRIDAAAGSSFAPPMIIACSSCGPDSAQLFRMLLEARADANVRNGFGHSCLSVIAGPVNVADDVSALQVLLNARADLEAAQGPCASAAAAAIELFVRGRHTLGYKNEWSRLGSLLTRKATPLDYAASCGLWHVSACLLAHGASRNARVSGKTPAELARYFGHSERFQAMLRQPMSIISV
eukprot:TRINITY_DN29047_c0_g1_i1.p1 TRINITY_DN29047_c0_g1~~TRINITY_DN29047_c0_g1_i1.p1  ORF type:complete len:606 (+),score=56.38 TRINITY_DN29047_c0_g1_i1:47-1864(+)